MMIEHLNAASVIEAGSSKCLTSVNSLSARSNRL